MPHLPHFVIIPDQNGIANQFALKNWVLNNGNILPNNFDGDGTSHQLRRRLINIGWRMNITENAVFVIMPNSTGDFQYADYFLNEIIKEEENEISEIEENTEITFSLERDMQKALRLNIGSLENNLRIIDGGKERNTEAGRIDITAIDEFGKTVVIELKAIEAKSEVIAQILSYMEAVKQEDKTDVRGIIVASDFSNRVKLAARQINSIKLFKYSFQFNFNNID